MFVQKSPYESICRWNIQAECMIQNHIWECMELLDPPEVFTGYKNIGYCTKMTVAVKNEPRSVTGKKRWSLIKLLPKRLTMYHWLAVHQQLLLSSSVKSHIQEMSLACDQNFGGCAGKIISIHTHNERNLSNQLKQTNKQKETKTHVAAVNQVWISTLLNCVSVTFFFLLSNF